MTVVNYFYFIQILNFKSFCVYSLYHKWPKNRRHLSIKIREFRKLSESKICFGCGLLTAAMIFFLLPSVHIYPSNTIIYFCAVKHNISVSFIILDRWIAVCEIDPGKERKRESHHFYVWRSRFISFPFVFIIMMYIWSKTGE